MATAPNDLTQAFELYRLAKAMMLQSLRDRFPAAEPSEIQERLRRWQLQRDPWAPLDQPPHFDSHAR